MDKGYAQLATLCDHLWWADIERQRREYDARKAHEQAQYDDDPGSTALGKAQDRYEAEMIDEARAMVAERNGKPPTREHLRVLLEWLDRAMPAQETDGGKALF